MPRIGAHFDQSSVSRALMRAAFIVIAMGIGMTVHARQVGVNGPAALPEPPPTPATSLASSPVQASANTALPAAANTGSTAMSGGTVTTPVSESRPLGRPNALLSSRPVDEDAGDGTSPALGALDPRDNGLTRVLGALAAVIGLIVLTKIVVSRYFPNLLSIGGSAGRRGERPSGVIEVLARYPLPGGGRGQQLIVLKFARRVILAHQAGTSLTTLSEMTDPGEVAGLLARLEAGASEKSQQKFRAALESYEQEHDSAAKQSRAGAAVAATQTEIIDLTRTPMRGIGGVVRARRLLR